MPGDTEGTKMVMDLLRERVEEAGVEVRYETGATNLVADDAGARRRRGLAVLRRDRRRRGAGRGASPPAAS